MSVTRPRVTPWWSSTARSPSGRRPARKERTVTEKPVAGAIDVHGHAVPRAFLDEVVRSRPFGVEAEVTEDKYFVTFPGRKRLRPVAGVMLDTTDRRGWFAEQEVTHQVVAPWLDLHGQELPAAGGGRGVRLLHDAVGESIADPA